MDGALSGMVMAFLLAIVIFRMPAELIGYSTLLGFVFGFMRIAWIIVASIFLYNVAVETGQFQVMKDSIANLSRTSASSDLDCLLLWRFLEGTGGGGRRSRSRVFPDRPRFPAVSGRNGVPAGKHRAVAWGAVGNPIRVLTGVTACRKWN